MEGFCILPFLELFWIIHQILAMSSEELFVDICSRLVHSLCLERVYFFPEKQSWEWEN